MKIEQRVTEAMVAAIDDKDFSKAMNLICPAIEASARKKLGKTNATGKEFKDFLRSNYFIIEAFIGAGINFDKTRFPNVKIETDDGRSIIAPDLADIVWVAFRCSLQHGHEISEKFAFTASSDQGYSEWEISMDGKFVHMPDKIVWALIACVVFCKANAEIVTDTDLYLTWGAPAVGRVHRFGLDKSWGAEATLRTFLAKQNLPRVTLDFEP